MSEIQSEIGECTVTVLAVRFRPGSNGASTKFAEKLWRSTKFEDFEVFAFRSSTKAFQAAKHGISENCRIGLVTADVDSELAFEHLVRIGVGVGSVAEWGQIVISLSTQELVRGALDPGKSFIHIGSRQIFGGGMTRLFAYSDEKTNIDFSGHAKSLTWNPERFVGRSREIEEIKLAIATRRIISLHGPSGIGKTSLCARVVAEIGEDFSDGAVWVDLTNISRKSLVLHRIASVLEISSASEISLLDQICAKLATGSYLLILDNADSLTDQLDEILEVISNRCPETTAVITSTRRIQLDSAYGIPLEGLEFPSPFEQFEASKQFDAVRLFEEMTRSVYPGFLLTPDNFSTVVQILHRVEGSPLAIAMLTSRLDVLSEQQLLSRLKDDPLGILVNPNVSEASLSQTLRAVYQTLSRLGQAIFRRLWVFRGPFTLESIRAICSDDQAFVDAIYSVVKELLELRLIKNSGALGTLRTFTMGSVQREFAMSISNSDERKRTKTLAEQALTEKSSKLTSGSLDSSRDTLDEFEILYEDLRWRWLFESKSKSDIEKSINQVLNCRNFWMQKCYFNEGVEICERLIAHPKSEAVHNYARIISLNSWFHIKQGRYPQARALIKTGLRIAFARKNDHHIELLLNAAGGYFGEIDRPRSELRVKIFSKQFGPFTAIDFRNLAMTQLKLGFVDEAAESMEQAKALFTEDDWSSIPYHSTLASLHSHRREWDSAVLELLEVCNRARSYPYLDAYPGLYLSACFLCIETGRLVDAGLLLMATREMNLHFGFMVAPRRRNVMSRYQQVTGDPSQVISVSGWNPEDPLALLEKILNNC